ncbi:MutS N-terminal domain-containing protein [Mesorhizobium sp. ArgA1]
MAEIVLQRGGDYLEAFNEDAIIVGDVLGLAVTRAPEDGADMVGIPIHAQTESFAALHSAGYKSHLIAKPEALDEVWQRTHAEFKGTVDGRRTLIVVRHDGPTLVLLVDLTPAEMARLYPRSEL